MWTIRNRTPYAAERGWTRDRDGRHLWLVAVKATFTVREDGTTEVADEQPQPLVVPEYRGDPASSSLRADVEVTPEKPTTDVVVNGSAHAPGGRPVKTLAVGLRVGPVAKDLVVHGTRVFRQGVFGLAPSTPLPFAVRPIAYEDAFGGAELSDADPRKRRIDRRNPVGLGLAPRADAPAPSVEYPGRDLRRSGPAGLGAIAPHWSPRVELAGTYDAAWERGRRPLLPQDWDPRHLLCAPADQRPERHLQGGEPVAVVHMTPGGVFQFELPRLRLAFATFFGRRVEEHRAKLGTVLIEPEQRRVALVWQTSLAVRGADVEHLDETVVWEKAWLT